MPWEVRYFSRVMDDYTNVAKWFRSIDDNFETEKRDDMYIYSPKLVDIGIKIKQISKNKVGSSKNARLEIKWRKSKDRHFSILDGRINGFLEEWTKFSLEE